MDHEDVTIVAAAIKKHDKVYEGLRHALIIPTVFEETGERVTQDEQGFLTSDGQFVSRWRAGSIAYQSGQTKIRHETLLSEHVW